MRGALAECDKHFIRRARRIQMPGTNNMFQAFRCRTSRLNERSGHAAHGATRPEILKKGQSAVEESKGLGGVVGQNGASAAPRSEPPSQQAARSGRSRSYIPAPRKRQRVLSRPPEQKKSAIPAQELQLSSVCMDRMADTVAADKTAYEEDIERPAAATLLSEISRRARGREGINLDDAMGLPERLGDKPLRLIIGGNNPSDHAWQAPVHLREKPPIPVLAKTGHYYSHKSNRMWKILPATGIVPAWANKAECDERVLHEASVGFTDVGTGHPGTILSNVESKAFEEWAPGLYERLRAHTKRACDSIGCTCGECGAPAYIAWSGKRQWMELLNVGRKGKDRYKKLDQGLQHMRPQGPSSSRRHGKRIPSAPGCLRDWPLLSRTEGWPLPRRTKVWVCSSTSGAAPMTSEERLGPWQQLSDALKDVPWPPVAQCSRGSVKAEGGPGC